MQEFKLEDVILRNLMYDAEYVRSVIPYLKGEYFEGNIQKILFTEISNYIDKYNSCPTKEALIIDFDKLSNITTEDYEDLVGTLNLYHEHCGDPVDYKWLLEETERWCRDRAIFNALYESIRIANGDSKEKEKSSIPEILTEALSVSFDSHIGQEYFEDASDRWDFYNRKEERIPFDIDFLNLITNGGVWKKSLNILMGGTGTFKTGCFCHFSANYLMLGKNVLYITLELAEEEILKRVDANLMNIKLDDLDCLPKKQYMAKVEGIREKTLGKLIVHEYPTSSAHVGHFRYLIKELRIKKNFSPDVIIIDYLNICASSRLKGTAASNMYQYVKAIAEEVRGLAVEFNVPIWSGTQLNRGGFGSSDIDLTNTSESFGLPATADLFLGIIATEDLDKLGQLMFKQLKNRKGDIVKYRKFCIGVDKARMRLFNLEPSAQTGLSESGQEPADNMTPLQKDVMKIKQSESDKRFSNLKI